MTLSNMHSENSHVNPIRTENGGGQPPVHVVNDGAEVPISARHHAAVALAEAGIPVFPCQVSGKHPLPRSKGFKDRTTDKVQINAWWTEADYNLAIVPEDAGWCVVDTDPKNGGEETRARLIAEHGDIPLTKTVQTPSGGTHLYFKGSLPGKAGALGSGVDTRGRLSYVLVPPSGIDGVEYSEEFDWLTVAELPDWIKAAVEKPAVEPRTAPEGIELDKPYSIKEAREWLRQRPQATEGSASDTLYKHAAALKDMALSQEMAVELLHERNPSYDPDDIAIRVANAWTHGQNEPGCDVPVPTVEKFHLNEPNRPDPFDEKCNALLRRGSSYRMRKVEWLWKNRLAAGKFHIIGGQKGAGKSTLAFDWLAKISVGGLWPDGTRAPLGDVLIWSSEDDVEDTIKPRFVAAGGDPDRLYCVAGIKDANGEVMPFDPARDMPALRDAIQDVPNVKAVMIDPIVSVVAGDSHKNAETRRGLQPLVDLAVECHAAVIGITHFTKNTQGRDPIERITGSLAFGALARIVYGVAKDIENEDAPRKLVCIASNIGPSGGGFEYTLRRVPVTEDGVTVEAQQVVWGKVLRGSAMSLLAGEAKPNKSEQAYAWLADKLREAGTAWWRPPVARRHSRWP